jgi:UDP-N-acetylmuramoylalanine--D-glutamate ligase
MNLKEKKVLVVGLGKSGVAAIQLLVKKGARVYATDKKKGWELKNEIAALPKGILVETGSSRFFSMSFDLIVTSPGVPWNHPGLEEARRAGVPVWPELELSWRCVNPKTTVAVTGTNGKTTTTALIGSILKKAGWPVVVGGNIGTPLAALIKKVTSQTTLVLEVSSYQLEAHQSFHPNVGVFLNLTPDHLDRHGTMSQYANAKSKLFSNFTHLDTAVLNGKDPWCRRVGSKIVGRKVWFPSDKLLKIASHIRLPGDHNLNNAMAAVGAVKALGLNTEDIIRGLESFKGVPHRIQVIRTVRDVTYVNDSKSTNVNSTLVALKSFKSPFVLIRGGRDKGFPYTPLIPYLKKTVKEVLTIGEAAGKISAQLKNTVPVVSCHTLERAVKRAFDTTIPGDVVLLSPACASFDQFQNYEHRGEVFQKLVKRLRP